MAEIAKDLDFWRFAAMGQFIKTVLWGRKEAAMYSYNGVVLPALTNIEYVEVTEPLDFSVYPYIAIYDGGLTYFVASKKPITHGEAVYSIISNGDDALYSDGEIYGCWYNSNKGKWYSDFKQTVEQSNGIVSSNCSLIWANHDISSKDDSTVLVMAKSEPIPVYE